MDHEFQRSRYLGCQDESLHSRSDVMSTHRAILLDVRHLCGEGVCGVMGHLSRTPDLELGIVR
jgi:hypothetical protein